MKRFRAIALLVSVLVTPLMLPAQDIAVNLVEFDDGFNSYVYAYVRAETNPISQIDERGITFGRDPLLVFACINGTLAVAYRFDTELLGEDNVVRVEHRFDDERAAAAQMWSNLIDPTAAAEMNAAALMLTGDSAGANPVFDMFANMTLAAQIPREFAAEFLSGAEAAKQLTMRVTDPFDGETHIDVFPLTGFASVMRRIRETCKVD